EGCSHVLIGAVIHVFVGGVSYHGRDDSREHAAPRLSVEPGIIPVTGAPRWPSPNTTAILSMSASNSYSEKRRPPLSWSTSRLLVGQTSPPRPTCRTSN